MHHHRGMGPATISATAAAPALANTPDSAGSDAYDEWQGEGTVGLNKRWEGSLLRAPCTQAAGRPARPPPTRTRHPRAPPHLAAL